MAARPLTNLCCHTLGGMKRKPMDLTVNTAGPLMHHEEKFNFTLSVPTILSPAMAIVNQQTCQWLICSGV